MIAQAVNTLASYQREESRKWRGQDEVSMHRNEFSADICQFLIDTGQSHRDTSPSQGVHETPAHPGEFMRHQPSWGVHEGCTWRLWKMLHRAGLSKMHEM